MTLQDLKDRIASITHRKDLSAQMNDFISDAQLRMQRRFGITFAAIDPVPARTEMMFLYAALQSAYEHLNNGDNAKYYADKFELEADRQNVLDPGTVTDNYATEPPYIIGA